MKFKNLKINQRFKFIDDPKIYTKETNTSAVRNLTESYIFQNANVELVDEDEKENYEEVEKRLWLNQRLEKN
jgi:hypothetical protein